MSLKKIAIVTAHFPPSNLTCVHRSRLWAAHLEEFGWKPVIVTSHWDFYEERLDWSLNKLVSPDLEVVRTQAFSTKPIRLVGDVGIRGFWWHYKALLKLISESRVDFVLITIPSNFSALLGRLIFRKTGIPYGIDYQDPWVPETDLGERFLSKAWISRKLGQWLEPWAVAQADLITGVGPGYLEGVLKRNPGLMSRVRVATMPVGMDPRDFERVHELGLRPTLFDPSEGDFNLVFAGVIAPTAEENLRTLLQAVAHLKSGDPDFRARFRAYFIGTGRHPDDKTGFKVRPIAETLGLEDIVIEHPHRMPYTETLAHLAHSSACMILGSAERHYTPSKALQVVLSKRPVFAILHRQSEAFGALQESGAAQLVGFDDRTPLTVARVADGLQRLVAESTSFSARRVRLASLGEYTARSTAAKLAEALDKVISSRNCTTSRESPTMRLSQTL